LNAQWVEPDIRDHIVRFTDMMAAKTNTPVNKLLGMIGISSSKYYSWIDRFEQPNNHNSILSKKHWILDWEREAIINYANNHIGEGYRRLTYMMIDDDIAAVSPSTTYRVLKAAGLLNRWNKIKKSLKGNGFDQPIKPHQHWHTDIKYVNFQGTFLFLISVIDGYSRYIVHHELRKNMQEFDVEITLQRALEKYPLSHPRIITDNGSQYVSKDFAQYIKQVELQHIRTSIAYPQSNGKIERYHRTIHQECLMTTSLIDLDDARKQIVEYIDFYNTKRLHSSLFYLTPDDFLNGRDDEKIKVRKTKLQLAKNARYEVRNVS
jgi:transposase InsO family protein